VISGGDKALLRADLIEAGAEIEIIEPGGTEHVKAGSFTPYGLFIVFVGKI
jgi:hypothetical protein